MLPHKTRHEIYHGIKTILLINKFTPNLHLAFNKPTPTSKPAPNATGFNYDLEVHVLFSAKRKILTMIPKPS